MWFLKYREGYGRVEMLSFNFEFQDQTGFEIRKMQSKKNMEKSKVITKLNLNRKKKMLRGYAFIFTFKIKWVLKLKNYNDPFRMRV